MKENLFIFGNGFDLAHGFKTSYNNFKSWLQTKYSTPPANKDKYIDIPEYTTNYRRLTYYNDNEVAAFFNDLISEICADDWNEFEKALAQLNWERCYEVNINSYVNEIALLLIDKYFPSWVKQIDITKPKIKFNKLIELINDPKNKNYFLSFNYTDTLEQNYNVESVCHLHGRASENENLIIGHEKKAKTFDFYTDRYETDNMMDILFYIYEKDTEEVFKENKRFFDSLNNVLTIYFYGFSFSDVDIYYLDRISETVDCKNILIYLHSYDTSKRDEYIKKLTRSGFLLKNIRNLHNDFTIDNTKFNSNKSYVCINN